MFRELIAEDPRNPALHFHLGNELKKLSGKGGDRKNEHLLGARDALLEAIRIRPDFTRARNLLIWTQLQLRRASEAAATAEAGIERGSADADTWFFLYAALRDPTAGAYDPERAEEALEAVRRLAPDHRGLRELGGAAGSPPAR